MGRNPVEDIYTEESCPFKMDKATILREGRDVAIIACGEMVRPALDAADILSTKGIRATVVDMYCIKPFDRETILKAAQNVSLLVTVEEHSLFGGLGSMVSQVVSLECPKKVVNMALPDTPVIAGTSKEVFDYYGLNADGIVEIVKENL